MGYKFCSRSKLFWQKMWNDNKSCLSPTHVSRETRRWIVLCALLVPAAERLTDNLLKYLDPLGAWRDGWSLFQKLLLAQGSWRGGKKRFLQHFFYSLIQQSNENSLTYVFKEDFASQPRAALCFHFVGQAADSVACVPDSWWFFLPWTPPGFRPRFVSSRLGGATDRPCYITALCFNKPVVVF